MRGDIGVRSEAERWNDVDVARISVRSMKMARKTVPLNPSGIGQLPENKPVVYKVLTEGGKNNYTGTAQKGRVQERLQEHLGTGKDPIPGAKVAIEQMASISEARAKEQRIIARTQPKYNEQGK